MTLCLTHAKSSGPRQLLSYKHIAPITIFKINTYRMLASAHSKELAEHLTPLNATLTENRGCHPSSQILLSVPLVVGHIAASHLPYILPSSVSCNPFVCHSYEKPRGVPQLFPVWNSSLSARSRAEGSTRSSEKTRLTPTAAAYRLTPTFRGSGLTGSATGPSPFTEKIQEER